MIHGGRFFSQMRERFDSVLQPRLCAYQPYLFPHERANGGKSGFYRLGVGGRAVRLFRQLEVRGRLGACLRKVVCHTRPPDDAFEQ